MKKKKNNHFPHLPEEEINKLVEEMIDPNLIPQPYFVNNHIHEPSDKVKKAINELVAEYNRKVVKIIEEEKKEAFEEGRLKERKTHAKN